MIEGHTDDIPIRTSRYPSNWELSTARAISAMRFMVAAGIASARVGVAGYADLRPLQPNDSQERRSANRRVELVFMRNVDAG
jgi:chemotaxis protein MotB